MAEVGSAFVTLVPSTRGWSSAVNKQVGGELDKSGKTLGKKFGSKIGSALKLGLLGGGVALAAFGKASISAASDAQQSFGATETVFGKFADTVIRSSDRAAQKYGLSANTYRENANLIGSLFKNQGVAVDELAGKTDAMIGVGADLAATFGGTTTDAVQALGAAFKGEFDSMEKYGVSLKESTVSAELAARGQDKLTGAQLAGAKQAVVTDLIMQQSKDSLGAFGKESNTLAGQQQRLGASFDNIKVTVGTALLPVLTRFAEFVNGTVLPAVKGFLAGMKDGTGVGGEVAAVFKTVSAVFEDVYGFVKANLDVIVPLFAGIATGVAVVKTMAAVTKVWAVAQGIMNAVLAANPIGIVIVVLAALVAGLVVAYKRSETFRNVVNGAFDAVAAAGRWLWNNALQPVFKFIVNGMSWVMDGWAKLLGALGKVPGFEWAGKAADAMAGAADKARALADGINKIPATKTVTVTIAQQFTTKGQLVGGLGDGGIIAGARAHGGPVAGGKAYLVGELGPELFVPTAKGQIVSHADLTRSTSRGQHGSQETKLDRETIERLARAIGRQTGLEINGAAASGQRRRVA